MFFGSARTTRVLREIIQSKAAELSYNRTPETVPGSWEVALHGYERLPFLTLLLANGTLLRVTPSDETIGKAQRRALLLGSEKFSLTIVGETPEERDSDIGHNLTSNALYKRLCFLLAQNAIMIEQLKDRISTAHS